MKTIFASKTGSSAFKPKQSPMRVFFRKITGKPALWTTMAIMAITLPHAAKYAFTEQSNGNRQMVRLSSLVVSAGDGLENGKAAVKADERLTNIKVLGSSQAAWAPIDIGRDPTNLNRRPLERALSWLVIPVWGALAVMVLVSIYYAVTKGPNRGSDKHMDEQTKKEIGYGHMHQQREAQTRHDTMNRGDSPSPRG